MITVATDPWFATTQGVVPWKLMTEPEMFPYTEGKFRIETVPVTEAWSCEGSLWNATTLFELGTYATLGNVPVGTVAD